MSRVLTVAVILMGFFVTEARAASIDLDKPGALEALERERPYHHKKVMEAIAQAQTIHVDPKPSIQNAFTGESDPRRKGATIILPTDPAKKRLTVVVDDVTYRVTAQLTESPPKLEKAR